MIDCQLKVDCRSIIGRRARHDEGVRGMKKVLSINLSTWTAEANKAAICNQSVYKSGASEMTQLAGGTNKWMFWSMDVHLVELGPMHSLNIWKSRQNDEMNEIISRLNLMLQKVLELSCNTCTSLYFSIWCTQFSFMAHLRPQLITVAVANFSSNNSCLLMISLNYITSYRRRTNSGERFLDTIDKALRQRSLQI